MQVPPPLPSNRLRELREQRGLKLYDIAALVRRDPSMISRYETGESPVPEPVWRILAPFYGVSVDFLMRRDEAEVAA